MVSKNTLACDQRSLIQSCIITYSHAIQVMIYTNERDMLIEEKQVSSMDDGALIGLGSPFDETPEKALKEG